MTTDNSLINQKIAANPNLSVWVSASAGTGKTTVLVNRLLRLFLSGINPSKILCLTYTKAGAMNMQNRIYAKTEQWAVMSDDDLKQELVELFKDSGENLHENTPEFTKIYARAKKLFSILVDSAIPLKIFTIHAFCTSILKRFPIEAGIPPHFKVIEGDEVKKLLQDSYFKLITHIKNYNSDISLFDSFNCITNIVSEFNIDEVTKDIVNHRENFFNLLSKYKTKSGVCAEIKKMLFSGYEDDVQKYVIDDNIFQKQSDIQDMFALEYTYICDVIKNISNDFVLKFRNALSSDISKTNAKNLSQLNSFTELSTINEKIKNFDTYTSILLTKDNKVKTQSFIISKNALKTSPELLEDIFVEGERISHALSFLKLLNIYRATISIINIGLELNLIYEKSKKEQSVMDFNDLITFVQKLFSTPNICEWILYKLDGGISHVLIDEAQDTSPLQWQIVDYLTDEFFTTARTKDDMKSIFTVGDRKQSIFSFQGANINLFETYRSKFKHKVQDNNFDFRDLPLNRSFRSCKNILNIVDETLKYIIPKDNVHHEFHRKDSDGYIEILPLVKKFPDTISDCFKPPVEHINAFNSSIEMANILATKIRHILDNDTVSCGKNGDKRLIRHIEPKDIMILVRDWNSATYITKALNTKNIPVSSMDRIPLSENIAIQDLISLLNFVLFPYDDLSLAEVLKSPLYNLNDDDLLTLCYNRKEKTIYDCMSENPAYKNVYDELTSLIHLAQTTLPFSFFDYVLKVLDKRRNFIARLGTEINDVLDGFMAQCLAYDNLKIAKSLSNFYEWFQLSEVEIKNDMENTSNKVRIMTIHSSKGLEAPIVFLYNANNTYKLHNSSIIWYNDFPIYKIAGFKDISPICTKIIEDITNKDLDEFYRLLYVAMTRARDKLYVMGMEKGKSQKSNKDSIDNDNSIPETNSWYSYIKMALEHNPNSRHIVDKALKNHKDSFAQQNNENDDGTIEPYSIALGIENDDGELIKKDMDNITQKLQSLPQFLFEKLPTSNANIFNGLNTVPSPLSAFSQKKDKELFSIEIDDSDIDINALNRGSIIHKLLDYLTKYHIENVNDFIINYFWHSGLPSDDIENLITHIISIYNNEKFKFLFHGNNQTEVELAINNGMGISSKILRIDNLSILGDDIWIVDYKTDKNVSDTIPDEYKKQLSKYKYAVSKIYPQKKIHTAILWIETEYLQEL